MLLKDEFLITINSKNRIQRIRLQLDHNPYNDIYTIFRITGQYGGKETQQPALTITEGKASRTTSEQAYLRYNSLLSGYLDKGYVKLASLTKSAYKDLSEEDLKTLLGGDTVSDTSGVPKPMLAKSSDQCTADVFEKDLYCSRKLNGVRCLMYYKDGVVRTASRGGKDYDVATEHIRNNVTLINLFKANPKLILDGELYIHDPEWPLQRISGTARLQERTPDCDNLQYWIYDYISDKPFKERFTSLMQMQNLFNESDPIKIIEHVKLNGYLSIKREHDKYVKEGFEGLVARTLDREYGINKRSAVYMIKLKMYQDAEFEIVGVKTGLRNEDMCFTLKTKDGKQFNAKPVGPAELKIHYLQHQKEYIGKKATCKFFEWSSDQVPQQPVLVHIRPDDE